MAAARARVDSAIHHVIPWPSTEANHIKIPSRDQLELLLKLHREKVDKLEATFQENIDFYTEVLGSLLNAALTSINLGKEKEVWILMGDSGNLMLTSDPLQLQLIMGLSFVDSCKQTRADFIKFAQLEGEQQYLIDSALYTYTHQPGDALIAATELYKTEFTDSTLGQDILRDKEQMQFSNFSRLCQTNSAAELSDLKQKWVKDFEEYFQLLEDVTDKLLDDVESKLDTIVDDAEDQFFIYIMVVALFALIAIYVAFWKAYRIYKMVRNIRTATQVLEKKSAEVGYERYRSEMLLCQILPPALVESMKDGKKVPVQTFQNTTIAYLDIVGFVALIVQHTPVQVVEILNNLYGMFDDIIESHHIQKIEQNNDVYCVASGVPVETRMHAVEIANFLIEASARLEKFGVISLPDVRIKCRIGAHSGPCAAGIVGHTIPRYSVFGETVKLASRMSRTGEVMKIQISEAMKTNLVSQSKVAYKIEQRGEIDVYGKGKMHTYFLLGRNN